MKTPLTRAGSRLVIPGNIARIDTPASKTASGLSCAVDRFKHWQHGGHITLQSGERSRLADFAGLMRRLMRRLLLFSPNFGRRHSTLPLK